MRWTLGICLLCLCCAPPAVAQEVTVLDRRDRLSNIDMLLTSGKLPPSETFEWLRQVVVVLRIRKQEEVAGFADPHEWREVVAEVLYRLDVIPAGLVLGQAAYESGYGTSRFMLEGNALFGQWTFGGEGMTPAQQRKNLGDYRIASFGWPFDSVRGYFLNLSSHPAYEDFRRRRIELKAANKPVTALALADGLLNYSGRGQEYVDTLKGIIRVDHFDLADGATARNEPLGFVIGVAGTSAAAGERARTQDMRDTGEHDEIILRMRLE
jgi:hypothetical protein